MKRNLRNKTLGFLCASALALVGMGCMLGSSAVKAPLVKGEEKIVYQSALRNWRLVGMPYTIENYSSAVRVFDPNGNPVSVSETGKITLTVAGEYVIVYPSGSEVLTVLLKAPVSEMTLAGELEESYPAGTVLTLPALDVENDTYQFEYYYITVSLDGEAQEILRVKEGKDTVYFLEKDGDYEFAYFVLNDRGEKESLSLSTVAEKTKAILADELPQSVRVGDEISVGWPYAYYDGTVYDVSVTVKKAGEETPVTGQSFTPVYAGEYIFVYAAKIGGETVTVEKTLTAYAPEEELFRVTAGDGEVLGVQELPSWSVNTDYTEGLLLKGATESVKFSYTEIVDLSTFTKEDNLLVFLPYSSVEEDAYMEGLRVVFTDVHDPSKKLSLYFWATEKYTGKNVPSSYATVEIGSSRYGIEHSDSRFGKLMSNTGAVADRSSFKGAHNNYSDVFSVQFDYLTEVLYLTSQYHIYPRQQYVYLPLSDKGELPERVERLPERYYFDGFTTGEVYMDVEMVVNKNAGVYLCELAGKKASELTADFEENFLVFDEAVTELATGAVNYEYRLPTAHLNERFEGTAKIGLTVKDGEGNTLALKNGGFTPTKAGVYQAIYSVNYYGKELERIFEVTVLEEPIDIEIGVSVVEPSFGGYMAAPEVTLSGGNGTLSYEYRVLLGGTEVAPARDGSYPVFSEGDLKIVVTARDQTGYEKTQEFEVEVQDGAHFALQAKMPKAIRKGWPTSVPLATAISLTEGVYKTETVTVKVYENGVEAAVANGLFTPTAAATEVRFDYSFACGGEMQTRSFEMEVLPEEILSVTEYLLTEGAVQKGITEKGILLTLTGAAQMKMPHPVAAESLLLTVGFHKESAAIDEWEIVLRDTELSTALILTLTKFNGENGTVSIALNGGAAQTVTGRTNVYTQTCGDAETAAKYAGKEYVLFSLQFDLAKRVFTDYETGRTLFNVTAFAGGVKFGGFAGNACTVEMSVAKSTAEESALLIGQIGNQYFNYGEDSFGYFDADGIPPTIVIDGDKTSRSVEYNYRLTVPAATAYDVLGGAFSVKVRIMANGEEVLAARDASEAFEFVLNEYKAYAIVYEANDFSGNRAQAYFNLTVVDEEAPALTVNGVYEKTVQMGAKVKILPFTATDGQGDVQTVVFIRDDQAKLTFVKVGDEYTFTKNGNYEIVYRSVDGAGNITRKAFSVVVK